MAQRAHLYQVLTDAEGNVLTGATVRVLEPDTPDVDGSPLPEAPIGQTLYDGRFPAFSDTVPNEYVCDTGVVSLWVDAPQYVQLAITPVDGTEYKIDSLAAITPQPDVSGGGTSAEFARVLLNTAPTDPEFFLTDDLDLTPNGHTIIPILGDCAWLEINDEGYPVITDDVVVSITHHVAIAFLAAEAPERVSPRIDHDGSDYPHYFPMQSITLSGTALKACFAEVTHVEALSSGQILDFRPTWSGGGTPTVVGHPTTMSLGPIAFVEITLLGYMPDST